MNDDAISNDRLNILLAECLRRLDRGEPLDIARLSEEHPEHADALLELIETAELIDQMSGPTFGEFEARRSEDVDDELLESAETMEIGSDAKPPLSTTDCSKIRPELASAAQAIEALVGHQIDEYQILSVLGKGGMGVVYKARQVTLDRLVAIKMILGSRVASDEDILRFYAEAQAASRTGHPNIVGIYEVGDCDGRPFFSMKYVEGEDLAHMIKQGPLDEKRAAKYLKTVAEAIHAAHESGVLHRDLKPGNVLIDAKDEPHVTDFGLAKYIGEDSGLTASGAAIGTPSYMAPEQASSRHQEVTRSTDVYALGAILYAMLTGRPPFRAETALKTMLDVMHAQPEDPSEINPKANRDLETICLKCLEKDPRDRYATAKELAEELQRFLTGQPIQAKPRGWFERTRHWMLNIPLVAAFLGRTVVHTTPAHLRAQAALILAIPMLVILGMMANFAWRQALPREIVIASGSKDGMYFRIANGLSETLRRSTRCAVTVRNTAGSGENRDLLLRRASHLCMLQASDLHGEEIVVVAPLYYEPVHVIVRKDSGITSVGDLKGKSVSLGPRGSGMRAAAFMLLEHYSIDPRSINDGEQPYVRLLEDEGLDGAIVTMGMGAEGLSRILSDPRFELLQLLDSDRLSHPSLRSYAIEANAYGDGLPANQVHTVATPAFLAARRDAPSALIEAALEAVYRLPRGPGGITRAQAAEWPGLALHPSAHSFFELGP